MQASANGAWYPPSAGVGGFLLDGQLFTNPPFKVNTMSTQHPITPPPELVEQWRAAASNVPATLSTDPGGRRDYIDFFATRAAQWGADQARALLDQHPEPESAADCLVARPLMEKVAADRKSVV